MAATLLGSAMTAQTTPPASPQTTPQTTPQQQLPDAPSTTSAPRPAPVPTGPTAVFDTTMGRLTCKLFSAESPIATSNFIGLAEGTKEFTDPVTNKKVKGTRFYDGTPFHRVIPSFMIQGGDRKADGTGDAGYFFDNESAPGLLFDVPGRLAMANAGPNTNGSQFFITELAYPDLDGKYTIFGQCDAHTVLMVATISRVDRDSANKPTTPIILNRLTIVREGQPIPPVPAAAVTPSTPPSTPAPAAAPQ